MLGVLGVASDISNRYHALRTIIVIKEMTHGGKIRVFRHRSQDGCYACPSREGAVMISTVRLLFAQTDLTV